MTAPKVLRDTDAHLSIHTVQQRLKDHEFMEFGYMAVRPIATSNRQGV